MNIITIIGNSIIYDIIITAGPEESDAIVAVIGYSIIHNGIIHAYPGKIDAVIVAQYGIIINNCIWGPGEMDTHDVIGYSIECYIIPIGRVG